MGKKTNKKSREAVNEVKSVSGKPDGGYGWVILLVAFLISFICDGCMYSFGIVLNEIKAHFQVTQDVVNLLQSINVGFLFMSGPVSSGLASQFGCRPVVMVASFIFGLMYVLCAFLPSIYIMIFTFGVIGGISFGCAYLTNFIILVDYFDTKLGLANGLTMAGSGLGGFVFAPFCKYLISEIGWQYTMVVLGSIILQCAILGALLRPVEHFVKKKPQIELEMEPLDSGIKHADSADDGAAQISCSQVVGQIVKETTNFKLLKESLPFALITFSNFFVFFVYFIPFIYIPIRAQQLGIDNYPWILSIIGIVNIPVRIFFGFIADRKVITAIDMNTACTLVASLTIFSYYLLTTFWMQACFAVFFAAAIAGMNCLTTPYVVEIVGDKKFSNANGIVNLFRGLGCIIGPYIAGFLSERTGTAFYSFMFAGFSYTIAFALSLSVSILLLVRRIRKSRKDKQDNREISQVED